MLRLTPLPLLAFLVGAAACGSRPSEPPPTDGDMDIDGDSDTDTDSDADSDADSDTDSEPEMVLVPEGYFWMGCNEGLDKEYCSRHPEELPFHSVRLSAFEIDKLEATQRQYAACVAAAACEPPKYRGGVIGAYDPETFPELPVPLTEWEQADDYCRSAGKRLPTEAEWEKAARGTNGWTYPWGNTPPTCDLVQTMGCGGITHPVGSHPDAASPYGALDMAGSVAEWLSDWYGIHYYETSPEEDPTGPEDGLRHMRRGGSWQDSPVRVRASARQDTLAGDDVLSAVLGVRCARSAE